MAEFRELASRLITKYGKPVLYEKSTEDVDEHKPWNVTGQTVVGFTAPTVLFNSINKTSPMVTDAEILGNWLIGIVASKDCDFPIKAPHTVSFANQKWTITNIETIIYGLSDVSYKWSATK